MGGLVGPVRAGRVPSDGGHALRRSLQGDGSDNAAEEEHGREVGGMCGCNVKVPNSDHLLQADVFPWPLREGEDPWERNGRKIAADGVKVEADD